VHPRDAGELDHAPADLAGDAVHDPLFCLALQSLRRVEPDGEVAKAVAGLRPAVADERCALGRLPHIHGARAARDGLDAGDRVSAGGLREL
jgi:hypothetical protein